MKDKLVILTGPTAVGKTDLSLDLAKKLNGEIISCDSMQIYKYMDIGTAKVSREEMEIIPHHLVDFIYPDTEYSVSDYQTDAKRLISEINMRGKIPIVVGGTGLYINSLVYDLEFTEVARDEDVRSKYEREAEEFGNKYIHDKLLEIDPESGEKIHANDVKRVVRALEVYEVTGKTMTEYNKDFRKENEDYDLAMVCLNMDRGKLYERINLRVDNMLDEGLIEEVEGILERGYDENSVALQGIGYKEIIAYINGGCSFEDAISDLKQGSRNYAKRQLTWFRRDDRFKWFNKDEYEEYDSLLDDIYNYIVDELSLNG